MSTYTVTVFQNNTSTSVPLSADQNLRDVLLEYGYPLNSPCGGNGTCGQCRVLFDGEYVSACKCIPNRNCVVTVPDTSASEVTMTSPLNIEASARGLGAAVDIGTTTVAVFLYDLESGLRIGVYGDRNAQHSFGADVISRIKYASEPNGLKRLSLIIRRQISGAVRVMCERVRRSVNEIRMISVAGNTVMQHIFTGISPESIGVFPYTPVSLFGCFYPAGEFFGDFAPNAGVYLCPALSGYVGGDITAGLLGSGAWNEEKTCLFTDIGTNGEMCIGNKEGFLCCAAAAGPAFEGAQTECGTHARKGAVHKVEFINKEIKFSVMGGCAAIGICGSGLTDAAAVLLRCGALTAAGRLLPPEEAPEKIKSKMTNRNGSVRYYFTDDVYISAEDIRCLQLAKAAVRAGIETLLNAAGKTFSDTSKMIAAGGFGSFMDVKNACAIGLLPPELLDRITHVGNSAGAGAALSLTERGRDNLKSLAEKCKYFELSESSSFSEKYIECMAFDETGKVWG
ncbi:MAG: ASKHA domain-containing protein [Oscillospiraceae bacterium]|nr:ASKHA domain-containing protein [Oscillospiraceae bacterium]